MDKPPVDEGTARPGDILPSHSLISALPGLFLILRADAPRYTIVAASDAYLRATRSTRDGPRGIVGRGIFEAFPDPPEQPDATGEQNVRASIERAIATRAPDPMPVQHYPVPLPDGTFEEHHWSPIHTPVLDPGSGRVTHVIQRVEDVTEQVRLQASLEQLTGEHADSERARGMALDAVAELTRERAALTRANEMLQEQAAELEMQTEALLESEAKYRSLFESIDEGFFIAEVLYDADGRAVDYRYLEANPALAEHTGLPDPVGRTAREVVPQLEDHWVETAGRVVATGEPARFEFPVAGLGRWFDVFAFRVGAPGDRRIAMLSTDISARRAMERERETLLGELQVERARLEDVFRQAPTFIAVLRGPEHVFELVNDAYYQLVGHRELLGKPLFEALPEVRDQGFGGVLDHVLATGEPSVGREVPLLVERQAGAALVERFIDLTYLPLMEVDGTWSGVIAHGADVTEQVLARREVERARDEAEAANRAKSEFLAVMSHELRTPLNAIGGYAELMEMGIRGPVTRAQLDDLRRIQLSQRHLLGLINEVLNYAKLETGTVVFDVADVPVQEALSAAELLVMPQARSKGLTLVVHSAPPALVVRADAEKLRQVLVNLASNAVKFTDAGGRIEISCARDGDRARIQIRDTGMGIPPDKLDLIFDPFVQVRSDLSRPHEGTGLGLAISRDLAVRMAGDLTVESSPGTGSTFTLTLPMA
ncbi:MAG TPA: ATP-binding protein [Longimicrobium sp.]|jgi:signal transduction histidine kinase|uniref:ATP-binding protein n=1 Tax=Longimicrobium sp. TaxID=2029185 RepID=UPI002ED81EC7